MGHATAETRFSDSLLRLGVRPAAITAFPGSPGPLLWNVVARFASRDESHPGGYYQGDVHMLLGLRGRLRVYLDQPIPARVDAAFVEAYRRWAAAPVLRFVARDGRGATPGMPEAALYDLRFMGHPGGIPYVVRLGVTRSGGPEREWMPGRLWAPEADQEIELP